METAQISQLLTDILTTLQLPFTAVEVKQQDEMLRFEIVSPTPSRIIGWHGETLNALQTTLKNILRTQYGTERSPSILLDVDGYRQMQEDKVVAIAKRKAEYARQRRTRMALPPMSPYYRRVVHMAIASDPAFADMTTESAGTGDYRQVIVFPKDLAFMQHEHNDDAVSEEMTPTMQKEEDDVFANLDV